MADDTNGTPQTSADDEVIIRDEFNINHDPADLVRYRGNWVAWSTDGRKVLVADPDMGKLFEKIDAAGLQPGEYCLSGIEANY
jgi:hypothetical protein